MKFSKIVLSSIFVVLFSVFANASFAQAKEHDGEIIAYMQALNNAEINTGKLAEDKKVDDAVMDYAKMMVKHHTDNLEVVTELSEKIKVPADETPAVNKFKEKNDADLAKLSKLDNAKFQKKYIQAMIKGHTDANEINNSNVGNDNSAFIRRSSFKYHTRGNLAKKGEMKTQRLLIANNSRYFEVISIFWLRLNALQQ